MLRQNEITEILTQVDSWSPEDRVTLAYQILRDMRKKVLGDPPRQTLEHAHGIGSAVGTAPTDDQVEGMMHQHRLEKYGR